jgi:DNA-directed RNA polymerase sigma subunit (sigma70/sigma32)
MESCSLDTADAGPHTLEEVAVLLNVSRERVRQLEEAGLENTLVAASRLLTGWEDPC